MDRKIERKGWFWRRLSLPARVGAGAVAALLAIVLLALMLRGGAERSVRVPADQLTMGAVTQGVFRDFVPLRGKVVPRDTVYLDAIEGGRVNRVLVEPGDLVTTGQPMIEFGNTNLQLEIIQQESQLNQAISQLQQNEISLEQNKISNERALAEADYNIIRLTRLVSRRVAMAANGAASIEQKENATDELDYTRELRRMQAESNLRQDSMRSRLLPSIHDQLEKLSQNLQVVRAKLSDLIVRAPVDGRVTDIDLKVGENRNPGQRLAEITPDTGIKLSGDIDEFYLGRVKNNQTAVIDLAGATHSLHVIRVYPQVKNGKFVIDLAFDAQTPEGLLPGQAVQGKLSLGNDRPGLLLPAGAFLERTGGDWIFVSDKDGKSAQRRRIKSGRRNIEQVEILDGLQRGERVIVSDYSTFDRIDKIDITH